MDPSKVVDQDLLCFLVLTDTAIVLASEAVTCSICQRICRPSAFARTSTLDPSACFARSVVDKAAGGCFQNQLVLKWHQQRQQQRKGGAELNCVGSLGRVMLMEHPYVYTLDVATQSVSSVRNMFENLQEDQAPRELKFRQKKLVFHVDRPATWEESDIIWISAKNSHTFEYFKALWDELDVAKLLSPLGEMILFSGYFVARRLVRKVNFHTDFSETGGTAFTFMTPLYDMSELSQCQLLGQTAQGTKQYRYKLGQAIVFGDDFAHSTEPGDAPHTVVFLCFAFGRKQITTQQWSNAAEYIKSQCPIYQNPCGHLVRSTA